MVSKTGWLKIPNQIIDSVVKNTGDPLKGCQKLGDKKKKTDLTQFSEVIKIIIVLNNKCLLRKIKIKRK